MERYILDIFKFKKDAIKEKIQLDMERIPAHIAIIMDGNGRWAKQRKLPRTMGHRAGMKNIKMMVEESSNLGVNYLTLYAFSTENWKRTKEEVGALMDLVVEFINKEFEELHRNNVKLNSIGDISKLPEKSKAAVEDAMYKTRNNTGLTLNIALNYGGRDEIVKGVKEIAKEVLEGKLQIDNIDDKIISDHLYTSGMPDPDIIIRPSGELRLSNYLLWQSAYSEFWFSNINWPDFTKEDLRRAISDFQKRDRRFGGV
ncbi:MULTISPECIES: isoprenyl transferase [unclassified Clostridium]|uniref:isoprenyl transferase n=1 Tax=uncultured Clostridium sp. TaxID=59620 RepID=UPI0032178F31